jgi:hypothetical protein
MSSPRGHELLRTYVKQKQERKDKKKIGKRCALPYFVNLPFKGWF